MKNIKMTKRFFLGVVPLSLAVGIRTRGDAPPPEAPSSLQTALEVVPATKGVLVKLSVVNPSDRYEIFQRMSCSWQQDWRCDNPGVILLMPPCSRDVPETIILPPHQSYDFKPQKPLFYKLKPGKATFRFGLVRQRTDFTSEELERIYHSTEGSSYFCRTDIGHHYKGGNEVFWSNPVTIDIRPEWIPR